MKCYFCGFCGEPCWNQIAAHSGRYVYTRLCSGCGAEFDSQGRPLAEPTSAPLRSPQVSREPMGTPLDRAEFFAHMTRVLDLDPHTS